MPTLIAYHKYIDSMYTCELKLPEAPQGQQSGQELCTLADGRTVVILFDGFALPSEQPSEIMESIENLILTNAIREEIKTNSPHVKLINQRMIQTIRASYSLDDEMYFARIGVGAANGLYTPTTDEIEAMTAFGDFVEGVRQWGRDERAKLGI